uniref:Very low-density lipoprotein receptor n=1 Tax=Rhabditophanes sp. KR3021 TaxID=114890 RepID=A0AC35TH76_9BILA
MIFLIRIFLISGIAEAILYGQAFNGPAGFRRQYQKAREELLSRKNREAVSDKTDAKKLCESNEFECANNGCIQKFWVCDGDDDCGDGSDELNCMKMAAGELCDPTEFKCAHSKQCIPQSYQCDGTNHCQDGSDEADCKILLLNKL